MTEPSSPPRDTDPAPDEDRPLHDPGKARTNSAYNAMRSPEGERTATPARKREDPDPDRSLFKDHFALRCIALRGRMSVGEVATKLGVHRNTIWNIERGVSLPDAFELVRLAEIYGTTVAAMLGQAQKTSWAEPSNRAVQIDSFVFVPHFDVQASAGTGSFQDIGNVIAMRPFDSGYIRGDLGISHDEIGLCGVRGNSGEPVLHSGDTVLVDFRDRSVMIEGLHIVRLDGLPLLKNLQRLPGKVLRVSSNNEGYAPFDIVGGEDSQRDFEVIGRVRWAGVTFR